MHAGLPAKLEDQIILRSARGFKLLLAFAMALSMLSLPGPMSAGSFLPQIHPAAANLPPLSPWYPAGSSMNKLTYVVYADSTAEQIGFQNGAIDIPDIPIQPSQTSLICPSTAFNCTPQISFTGYFE